ncbi:MAG: sodium-dependent transporter [Salinisphaera sp.]|nr:sodium-dependent transporter [Salinisphaera sp.]
MQTSDVDVDVAAYHWSSTTAFVLAGAGAVIGLGDVWRLPVLLGQYGGAAFLLVYVAALLVMALPLLLAQLLLGRGVRSDVVTLFARWGRDARLSPLWQGVGYLVLLGAALVLSFYSVIAGWTMAYVIRSAAGVLQGQDMAGLQQQFLSLAGYAEKGLGWHTIFMVAVTITVAHGLRGGIEPLIRWLTLASFAALALLALVAGLSGNPVAVLALLRPDFAALGWQGVMEALHQAFFSLSLGVGVLLAFGAYLPAQTRLARAGLAIVLLDLLFSLGAMFVVVSLLAGAGLSPVRGLELIFQVLPAAAAGWTTTLFFLLLLLVTLTSGIALLEPVVVWVMGRFHMRRVPAATASGLVIWFLGLGTLLSFNLMAQMTLLDRTLFEWLILVSSHLLLPAVGLLICLFVCRFLPPQRVALAWGGRRGFALWYWLLRYPARVGLVLVLLQALGVSAFVAWLW